MEELLRTTQLDIFLSFNNLFPGKMMDCSEILSFSFLNGLVSNVLMEWVSALTFHNAYLALQIALHAIWLKKIHALLPQLWPVNTISSTKQEIAFKIVVHQQFDLLFKEEFFIAIQKLKLHRIHLQLLTHLLSKIQMVQQLSSLSLIATNNLALQ